MGRVDRQDFRAEIFHVVPRGVENDQKFVVVVVVDRKGSSGGEWCCRVFGAFSGSGDDIITEAVFITGHVMVNVSATENNS